MNVPDWIKVLPLEQLPEPYRLIAHEAGIESAMILANLFQGTGTYFPKLDTLLVDLRNKQIRDEFDGKNHKELARKYDLTERWIYEVVSQQQSDVNQISFFTQNS